MTNKMEILKESLIRENIIKVKNKNEESFTLSSGKKSKFFISIKDATLNPGLLNQITLKIIDNDDSPAFLGICYNNQTSSEYYRKNFCIGSVAIGGVPLGTSLSLKTHIPQIIVRKEKHETGTSSQIIGNCKDKQVILIEDVTTTGSSVLNAVQSIRKAGGICNNCIVVVDREEGASKLCKENEINLISLLKKSDFGINEE